MSAETKDIIEFFKKSRGYLDSLFQTHVTHAEKKREDIFFLSHLMEIYDLSTEIEVLLSAGKCSAFMSIFRSVFEIFLNIRIVHSNNVSFQYLRYEYLKQIVQDIETKLDPRNGLLLDTSNELRALLAERIKAARAEMKRLRGNGISELSIQEKFRRGGYENFYKMFYGKMSSFVHGNILVLEERHIVTKSESKYALRYLQDPDEDELNRAWAMTTNLLFESTKIGRETLRIADLEDDFEESFNEFILQSSK
jgi:Family of unknown function (DUF5677)